MRLLIWRPIVRKHTRLFQEVGYRVRGLRADADFRAFVSAWKQRTGFAWKRRDGRRLWCDGYHEKTLFPDQDASAYIQYIIENPVRSGIVVDAGNYPLSGPLSVVTATQFQLRVAER